MHQKCECMYVAMYDQNGTQVLQYSIIEECQFFGFLTDLILLHNRLRRIFFIVPQ